MNAGENRPILERCGKSSPFSSRSLYRDGGTCTDESESVAKKTRCEKTPLKKSNGHRNPDRIGSYVILSKIGQGGMGVVYLAEQLNPVRRRVALKLIKPGLDSRAILARFDAERQALALMNHPNIAKVLDAGSSDDSRPYFVMEYCPGIPITEYSNSTRLTIPERLALFLEVCQAIQHSHQKGIIHRDLKPSNILVSSQETGGPTPKVIDFGISKAIRQPLSEETLVTFQGQIVGTPQYMSPEQTDSKDDVDTRTDIYSLGMILFELLVGALPYSLSDTSFFEMVRSIRETRPPRPSTRIGTSNVHLAEAANTRRTRTRSLVRELRGDLDWITLKALEKDRQRRYSTAGELAADIERHLHHNPVIAGPPGKLYRFKKFTRRNRAFVASVAVALFVLVAAGITSTVFYLREEAARRTAESDRTRALVAEKSERQLRERAESQRDQLLRLSDSKRLEQSIANASRLWPATPEKIPGMEQWLVRAQELAQHLPAHRESLSKLRESGIESDDGTRFSDLRDQWRHDVLTELVRNLETYVNPDRRLGTVADVEHRLEFARRIRYESLEKYDVEWQDAVQSIRNDCPAYQGLGLEPQLGLVPVGRDPNSGLWEFAHLQTGEVPDRDDDGVLSLTETTGLVFVLLPGAEFLMGSQNESSEKPNFDPDSRVDERPVHSVSIEPFFLSKYEMTQSQWLSISATNPSYYSPDTYDPNWSLREPRNRVLLHPVEKVSWHDCDTTLKRLGLELPTEAQWEFAARGGTGSRWWTGEDLSSLRGSANVADRYARAHGASQGWVVDEDLDDGCTVHGAVGTRRANPFGLHDTAGNVWEWCRDRYQINAYEKPVLPGDSQRDVSESKDRSYRGGGFDYPSGFARSAYRNGDTPDLRANNLGVRPARRLSGPRERE